MVNVLLLVIMPAGGTASAVTLHRIGRGTANE